MRNLMLGLVLALTMALGFLATPSHAQARETYHGFVKDPYYLGRGGTPATFEQIEADEDQIFRSKIAETFLHNFVGKKIGQDLNRESFSALLLNPDAARLIPCKGKIKTAGITNQGKVGWKTRSCYVGEMLIQIRLADGRWLTVASQGCYNPVDGELPSLSAPFAMHEMVAQSLPPEVMSYRMKRMGEVVTPGVALTVGGNVYEVFTCPVGCVCKDGVIISTPRVTTGGFPTTSGSFEN